MSTRCEKCAAFWEDRGPGILRFLVWSCCGRDNALAICLKRVDLEHERHVGAA